MSESIEEGKQEFVCDVGGFKTESRKGLAGHRRLAHQKPTSSDGYKQYVDDILAKLEEAWEARVKAHLEANHKRIDALEEQINDKEINSLLGTDRELPSSIECWAWVDIISPFLGGAVFKDTTHEAFAHLMKTNFRALLSRIHTQQLVAIAANVGLSGYSVEEVAAITNDEFMNKHLNELGKAKWMKSKSAQKEAVEKIENRAKEIAVTVQERNRNTELTERRRSNVEFCAKIISLVITVVMIVTAIYSYLILSSLGAAIVFSLFGVIFLALALSYKKIEVFMRELKVRLIN